MASLVPPNAYNALMGLFRPQAAPAGASAYDQAMAQARSNALGQFGMGLVAAAVPQTAAQRVQSLQGALGALQPSTTDIYNQAQARLMFQQAEDAATASERMRKMSDTILAGLTPVTTAAAPVVPPMPSRPTPSQQTFAATTPQATIAAPPPPTAAPSSGIILTEPEKLRIQNAAALGDEEVIKEYNAIIKDREKPKGSEYLGMQIMKQPDGSYAYVQPSKAGEPPIVLGPAPAPGEEEKATALAKTSAEVQAFQPKANRALIRTESNASNVMTAVQGALDILRRNPGWTTGKTGKLMEGVPNSDAYQLAQYFKTIKANIGFSELQQMRDASPTGGALGQVAVQELDSLQATKGSLDIGQSADALEQALHNIAADTDSTVASMYDAYEKDYGAGSVNREPLYDMGTIYNAPQAAIDDLIANADNKEVIRAFDRQFGKGASKYYIGAR